MQAKRAHHPVETGPWDQPGEPARPIAGAGADAAATDSPALRLRAELAARLAELYHPEPLAATQAATAGLPMAARLAIICGLSLAGWIAIGVGLARFL